MYKPPLTQAANTDYVCPSKMLAFAADNRLSYPIFYYPELFQSTKNDEGQYVSEKNLENIAVTYKCDTSCRGGALTNREFHEKHNPLGLDWIEQVNSDGTANRNNSKIVCVDFKEGYRRCPARKELVDVAWKVLHQWPYRANAICALGKRNNSISKDIEKLGKVVERTKIKKKVNIILFGGSKALGHDSLCCKPSLLKLQNLHEKGDKPKCFEGSDADRLFQQLKPLNISRDMSCAWSFYFMYWLEKTYGSMNDFRFYNLASPGCNSQVMAGDIHALLENENIKITEDDVVILDHSANDYSISNGVGPEMLIRGIYQNSLGKPTILLVEDQYNGQYFKFYREIATHYKLPLFSFHDIQLSFPKEEKNLFTLFTSYPLHAPFHFHMYLGDLMSRFVFEMVNFECHNITGSSSLLNPVTSDFKAFKENGSSFDDIPPVFYKETAKRMQHECHHKASYLIQRSASHAVDPTHQERISADTDLRNYSNNIGSHADHSHRVSASVAAFEMNLTTWTEFVDFKETAGWIINTNADKNKWDLVFPFQLPKVTAFAGNSNGYPGAEFGLHLKYLTTYSKAGSIDIIVCKEKIDTVDALIGGGWRSTDEKRISVPTWAYFEISPAVINACLKLNVTERNVTLRYLGGKVIIRHVNRGYAKFKLFSIEMCHWSS